MAISMNEIQRLRDETGAGVMECKKALDDAKGNFDKAVALVRERGLLKVEKRSSRDAGAGLIESYVHNGRIGVLLDLRAETDFVVRSADFQRLAKELVMHIAASSPSSNEELLSQPYIRDENKTIDALVKEVAARVGENIRVNSFSRLEI
jgi:elongation factor Ts